MRLHFGIIGNPLKQSFSARYFNEKFEREGIDAEYSLYPLENIKEVKKLWEEVDFKGMNVTIPYKIAVIPYLDGLDETAEEIGAVNVIAFRDGKKIGYNSDALGFLSSIRPLLTGKEKTAVVLGSGGASKAVQYGLRKLGLEVSVASRKTGSYPVHPKDYDVIVNATPLGMYPETEACADIVFEELTERHLVYDCIYNPEETLLMKKAKAQGACVCGGMGMLLGQAEGAWDVWNKETK